jgi:hypothetical protein
MAALCKWKLTRQRITLVITLEIGHRLVEMSRRKIKVRPRSKMAREIAEIDEIVIEMIEGTGEAMI